MSTYVFDQTWDRERERLESLESIYDEASIRLLERLGVSEGWSCLEVGCGVGGLACWMADRVGTSGRVVATDVDTHFLQGHGHPNLDVRSHDILEGPPEQGAFDLVHARAVIEHVGDRSQAMRNLLSAVRPGGWVLIEDTDFGGPMATALARYFSPSEHAALLERLYLATEALFTSIGAEGTFGTRLTGALESAGFAQVGGELHAEIVSGGSEQWTRGSFEQLRPVLVRTGLVSDEDITRFLILTEQSWVHYPPPAMVSVWGRRPAA